MAKRMYALALILCLLCSWSAWADTVIDGNEDRGITPADVGLNETPEGVSPTTGRTLSGIDAPAGFSGLAVNGRYQPILVQIDNTDNGKGYRAPWNGIWGDIYYESSLRREGHTRISILYSDVIPDDVGPVRSARIGHIWLRQEWGAGFVHYGQQEFDRTNVKAEVTRLGAADMDFSGTAQTWKAYFYKREKLKSPHDIGADLAGLQGLIPADKAVPDHAFLFTDEPAVGDAATVITVNWGRKDYRSVYTWSPAVGAYTRSVGSTARDQEVYHDLDSGEAITFANVIVQWVDMDWPQVQAPVMRIVGDAAFFTTYGDGAFIAEGNADFFMNGVHVAGYWRRESMDSRTVFYGPDGSEIELQRGRTMIILFPNNERIIHTNRNQAPTPVEVKRSVSYK